MIDDVKKRIVFVTGTRADYGKMKSLMLMLEKSDKFDVYIFVCGMHLSKNLGATYEEVIKDGYSHVHVAYGLKQTMDTSVNLGNTVSYFSGYTDNVEPDMIVVHGDRMDALAGAIVGALHNIMVAHIEGGELSGTIDESIRHAISKFAHIHFVCTDEAGDRLVQLGEEADRIHVIGSPDIDIMMSKGLPTLEEAKGRYGIDFCTFGILMYHPVTTEYNAIGEKIKRVVDAVIDSGKNYIVIFPNNDFGSEIIIHEYERFKGHSQFRVFPSIRFEYFLTLLRNAEYIIGNSSAGIREAGIYGVPAIDVGTRQNGRYNISTSQNIVHVDEDVKQIEESIENIEKYACETYIFGDGNSTMRFYEIISNTSFWNVKIQKHFVDLRM